MHGFLLRVIFDPHNFDSIIDACIQGNRSAQRELFKKYYAYGKSICLRYTSSLQEADEVLNEGFLKVFNNLEKFNRDQPFKAWLRTILVNTAISYFRKMRKYKKYQTSYDDHTDYGVDDDILGQITSEEILGIVHQLKPIYKTVFLLNVVDGYSLKEIADLLNINPATVRSHFSRARL
jgi:RNA polymerase sigma-70 factor (ECF subfamily)